MTPDAVGINPLAFEHLAQARVASISRWALARLGSSNPDALTKALSALEDVERAAWESACQVDPSLRTCGAYSVPGAVLDRVAEVLK